MRPVRNYQLAVLYAGIFQRLQLLCQNLRIYRYAVADYADRVLAENSRWQKVQCELAPLVLNGVAGIAASLKTNHIICVLCQAIGNFSLTFIAPICSYNCCNHISSFNAALCSHKGFVTSSNE